jgi:hypothetical protein
MIASKRQAAKLPSSFSRALFEEMEHILGEKACNMPRCTSSSMRVRFPILIINSCHIVIKS